MFAKNLALSIFLLSSSLLADLVILESSKPAQNEVVNIFASPYLSRYADVPASLYRLGP